eukprot:2213426-Rhodomonas_salina.1
MDNVIPPSAAAAPDALGSLLSSLRLRGLLGHCQCQGQWMRLGPQAALLGYVSPSPSVMLALHGTKS